MARLLSLIVITLAGACAFQSNLPLMQINTHSVPVPDEPKITADLVVNWDPSALQQSFTVTKNYEGPIGIELHGQSSQANLQKSYGIELRSPAGGSLNAPLLSLPSENDWILHAPFNDKSLVRNHLAYALSNSIGRYAPRTRFVELFLHDTGGTGLGDYVGVYVLTEKIKRDQHRVNIETLPPEQTSEPQISGGYILKVDKTDPGDHVFATSSDAAAPSLRDVNIVIVEPATPNTIQARWIEAYIRRFEAALLSDQFTDPINGYARYIDVASFADYLLLQELMKNVDAYRISSYMYKDRGGKLVMGPIWDFDRSSGNANAPSWLTACDPTGWAVTADQGNEHYKRPFWWKRLLQDPAFVELLVSRWASLSKPGPSIGQAQPTTPGPLTPGPLSAESIAAVIDRAVNDLRKPQQRHFAHWRILGHRVSVNCPIAGTNPERFYGRHNEEVVALKNWMSARVDWMTANLPVIGDI